MHQSPSYTRLSTVGASMTAVGSTSFAIARTLDVMDAESTPAWIPIYTGLSSPGAMG